MKFSILTILFVIHTLLLAGCSRNEEQVFELRLSILEDLRATLQDATQRIDFTEDGEPERYLIRGWQPAEQDGTWAKAKKSSLAFYRYDTAYDLELEIVCQALLGRNKRRQEVTLVLNGTEAGSFLAQPGAFAPYQMTLPASLLQSGRNVLEFHFSYITKPSIVDSSSEDIRWLSVKFQTITFLRNDHLESIDASRLLQRASSSVDLFLELPSRIEVELDYQNLQGATSSIEFISESGETRTLSLSPKHNTLRKVVRLGDEDSIYQIRFITKGPSEGYSVWERIQLNLPCPAPAPSSSATGFAKQRKPDILLYVVDTLRADHVGCYGYQRNTTPNLDRFASENALYRNAYAPDSWTRPSAASILTGLLPKNHKVMARDDKLSDNFVTLAELLQEHGYYTVAFVTNGNITGQFGFDQGFMQSFEFRSDKTTSTKHYPSNKVNEKLFPFLHTYLEQEERKPLFLMVWTIDPHEPYTPLDEVNSMFEIEKYSPVDTYDFEFLRNVRKGRIRLTDSQIEHVKTRYDQEIYFNDMSFGNFLDMLKSLNLYDDALIMFTSDHGDEFLEHGGVGHSYTLYNDQIQIPFVIKASQIEAKEHHERFQLIDIYPTILDVLGIDSPYHLDGVSLLSHIDADRVLYFEEEFGGNNLKAVLGKEKKVIYNQEYNRPPFKREVPLWEVYALHDIHERETLPLKSFADHFTLQQLDAYLSTPGRLDAEHTKVEMTPELDQKLRDLGYVK